MRFLILFFSIQILSAGIIGGIVKVGKTISKVKKVKTISKFEKLKMDKLNKAKQYLSNRNYNHQMEIKKEFNYINSKSKKKVKENKKNLTIKIASWNLQNLSINADKYKQNKIKNYIKSLFIQGVDIVCLQEIKDFNQKEINYNTLFPFYLKYKSEYLGQNTHKERYVILVHPKLLSKLKVKFIKVLKSKNFKNFKRPPFGLKIGNKLIVLNTHILYGNNINDRIKEVKYLKQKLKQLLNYYKIKNFLIAGDFNLDYKSLKKVFRKEIITTSKLTTNKNNYDHIITNLKAKRDLVSLLNRENISDHSPIRIILELKGKR